LSVFQTLCRQDDGVPSAIRQFIFSYPELTLIKVGWLDLLKSFEVKKSLLNFRKTLCSTKKRFAVRKSRLQREKVLCIAKKSFALRKSRLQTKKMLCSAEKSFAD